MNHTNNLIRNCLIENAKERKTLTYTKLYKQSGCCLSTDFSDKFVFYDLIERLKYILTWEVERGRRCLTIIVKRENEKMPLDLFFKLTKDLGIQPKNKENSIFYEEELEEVFATWEHKDFYFTFKNDA